MSFPRSLVRIAVAAGMSLATLGGCARPVAVPTPTTLDEVAPLPPEPDEDVEPPQVVIRDWANAPFSSVVGWHDDEWRQGLRIRVSHTGEIRDHLVYVGTNAFPNLVPWHGAIWHGWVDGVRFPKPLAVEGLTRDRFFCQRSNACTPYEYFSARVPDGMLRAVRDSLVVNVRSRNGIHETDIVIRRSLIDGYLAVVDSVRKARTRVASH